MELGPLNILLVNSILISTTSMSYYFSCNNTKLRNLQKCTTEIPRKVTKRIHLTTILLSEIYGEVTIISNINSFRMFIIHRSPAKEKWNKKGRVGVRSKVSKEIIKIYLKSWSIDYRIIIEKIYMGIIKRVIHCGNWTKVWILVPKESDTYAWNLE